MEAIAGSATITEWLCTRVRGTPDRTAFVFLENGEREAARLTFAQLDALSWAVAGMLETRTRPGDRVLLLYPSGLDFICALLGCLYAGRIAVPAYPPRRGRSNQRLQSVVRDCTPALTLTDQATLEDLRRRADHELPMQLTHFIATDGQPASPSVAGQPVAIGPDAVALLQYTSGSTGTPKGVMVNHRNILSNMEVITAAGCLDESSVFVSWLPLFHDMGLFGKVLLPLYLGAPSVLMDPAAFVQKPLRWLQAITTYRATVCAAPDSAYELCVRKVSEQAKAKLDLKSWRQAFNGAEPVRPQTVERFCGAFASCGFSRSTFRPVYGMAETTLYVTGQPDESLPLIREFDAASLSAGRVAPDNGGKLHSLVSCGQPWLGHRVRIVDPDTATPSPVDRIGEIWASGTSVAAGYWNQPEESERTFRARLVGEDNECYLRTGDLGLMTEGHLFVTGRLKDLIIIAGRNHYPQDLERTAEASHPALAPNTAAAFSDAEDGIERVVLTCEVRREALRNLDVESVAGCISRVFADEHEIELYALVLLKPATTLRTSSGKIQRSRIRTAYQTGAGLQIAGSWRKPARREAMRAPDAKDITAWLIQRIADTAGVDPRQIEPRAPFSNHGLDSRAAVALSGELQDWLGSPLSPTLVYDFPSIAQLADHLTQLGQNTSARGTGGTRQHDDDIAIIGMGCRFPGATDPEAFWQLLRNGEHAVSAPDRRVPGLPATALLEQVDQFDAGFFGINAREAETMDPQQRLLLEVAWETLEDAGIPPHTLAGSRTAVIVGVSNCDYLRLAPEHSADVGPYVATGNALSVAANRISYTLDLRGPSWAVDTACSSSLVAIHQACRHLAAHDCDTALVGGANLILAPQLSASFTQAGMLSPDGQCRSFDASANGYVRGEGVGLVLLKRMNDAIADGNTILAVIRGSAVSQDGRSNGLTAPNGPAQQATIRDALADAGVEPREIGFVETHGTGTPLGDPIELNSLVAVLNKDRDPQSHCWIASVKTNIGHLESAAGIASLIKTVLVLRHGEIPPHLHYRTLNPHIGLESVPFHIPTRVTVWTGSAGPRIAGISSFGFGGTNAHIIVAEAPPRIAGMPRAPHPASIVTLCARSPAALRKLAASYASFIAAHPQVTLEDFAFTANTGRTHFPCRAAIVASDLQELFARLTALAGAGPEDIHASNAAASTDPNTVAAWEGSGITGDTAPSRQLLEELARQYMQGRDIDWAALYRGYPGQRLALPHYPFERRRYWLDSHAGTHPLLGRRLPPQPHLPDTWTWRSRLDGPETEFLGGHCLMGSPVLPYSAYVDMALCAASQAGHTDTQTVAHLTLADLTLHEPMFLRADDPQVVQTVLSRQASGQFSFAVYHQAARYDSAAPWRLCASANLRPSATMHREP
jgi:acyl-CoA synthetase (AMP-forming)/AMP-acid ligase II/3-oxoacyl-(acyl-carrier-protein) synthase/acyl carrier protein